MWLRPLRGQLRAGSSLLRGAAEYPQRRKVCIRWLYELRQPL